MALHIKIGKNGEQLAEDYLKEKGYTILHRNWRYSHYEIDIIAFKENKLHIIEVKVRSSNKFGFPEEAVTKKKFRFLLNAADEFLHQNPQYRHVQYDVLAITFPLKEGPEFFLLEDVYL